MFTGLVQTVGSIRRLERRSGVLRLVVDAGGLPGKVRSGDSVAVNGVCLTVAEEGEFPVFEAVTETIERTTLGLLKSGGRVNLEGALAVGDKLGGHFVTGHVDGIGTVKQVRRDPGQTMLTVAAGGELMRDVVLKGSITIDGVSLTVAEVGTDSFTVALVPFTLEHTTLGDFQTGRKVNLETDLFGKWVRRVLETRLAGGVSESFLREHGFA